MVAVVATVREAATVTELLAELRRRDIRVWADGAQLRLSAEPGALTPDLKDRLQLLKQDLLDCLRSSPVAPVRPPNVVPLQPRGERTPVFGVGGHNGDVFCYRSLAQHLGTNQPFFGLQPPGVLPGTEPVRDVGDLASVFARQVRAVRGEQPVVIAGFCAGGTVAFELARQLRKAGTPVPMVALFAAPYPAWFRRLPQLEVKLEEQLGRVLKHGRDLAGTSWRDLPSLLERKLRSRKERLAPAQAIEELSAISSTDEAVMIQRRRVERATLEAVRRYTPDEFDGRLCLFLPATQWTQPGGTAFRWLRTAPQVEQHIGPDGSDADNILREPQAAAIAKQFQQALANAQSGATRDREGQAALQ